MTSRVSRDGDMKEKVGREDNKRLLGSKLTSKRENSEGECSRTNSRSCVVKNKKKWKTEEDSELVNMTETDL